MDQNPHRSLRDDLRSIEGGLVVSCQAHAGSAFDDPNALARFASAAVAGGAVGIRAEGVENIRAIRDAVNVPVLSLVKSRFPDGNVRITRSLSEVDALVEIGADVVAIDGTARVAEGLSGPDFILACRKRHPQISIVADISTVGEAVACFGKADVIATTLRGYTPETMVSATGGFDLGFLRAVVKRLPGVPVLAEGRVGLPTEVTHAFEAGAWAVVVGSAITRPQDITRRFVDSIPIPKS